MDASRMTKDLYAHQLAQVVEIVASGPTDVRAVASLVRNRIEAADALHDAAVDLITAGLLDDATAEDRREAKRRFEAAVATYGALR